MTDNVDFKAAKECAKKICRKMDELAAMVKADGNIGERVSLSFDIDSDGALDGRLLGRAYLALCELLRRAEKMPHHGMPDQIALRAEIRAAIGA